MKSHKQFCSCPLCKNYPEVYNAIVDGTLSTHSRPMRFWPRDMNRAR